MRVCTNPNCAEDSPEFYPPYEHYTISWCKTCHRERMRNNYRKNSNYNAERRRQLYQYHRDNNTEVYQRKRAYYKAYYKKNKAKVRQWHQRWRRRNPEKVKAIRRAQYLRDKQKRLEAILV